MSTTSPLTSHQGIENLIPYKPGKSILELQNEKNLTHIIKLASNENPLGCSPLAHEAIRSLSSEIISSYPSPQNHRLTKKLSNKLNIDSNQLFLSNGSDYIYPLLLNCYALHLNKHILVHDYAFSTYAIQAHTLNIPVNTVPINTDWSVNVDNLINACDVQTGIIFIANPNNPTGLLIDADSLKKLLDNIPPEVVIVLDEAYFEYAFPLTHLNTIEWLQIYPNLIITRTFSKIYGLAGVRIGYAAAHPDIVNTLYKVQLPFVVNQIALEAATAALDDEQFLNNSLLMNDQGKTQLLHTLDTLTISSLPSFCNFITFDCGEDCSLLYNYLLEKGIIVRPLHPYNMNQFIRVSIGTREQNDLFIKALLSYFS